MQQAQRNSQIVDFRVCYDAGWGNRLTLRGEGAGLSWQQGIEGICLNSHEWQFLLRPKPGEQITCKPLLNDEQWAIGGDFILKAGMEKAVFPFFRETTGRFERVRDQAIPLDIYLPPSYSENTVKHYPVLYVHDGQNLFLPQDSFKGESWEIHRAADRLIGLGEMAETIIVGIHHRYGRRLYDYTPSRDIHFGDSGAGGGAEEYGQILIESIKPFVESRYRVKTGPEHTGLMGASLGGLVSFFLGRNHPSIFGKIGCVSGSFWWNGRHMQKALADSKLYRPLKIYLDAGMFEPSLKDVRAMYWSLLSSGYQPGKDVLFFEAPFHRHSERYWAERVHVPLRFLFPHLEEKVSIGHQQPAA